jgi:branched-chain amino acid transport system ATP-binding protein
MLLEVKDIHVNYGALEAVSGISFSIPEGQIVSLLGTNGAGKSTMLRTISGLKKPTWGEIWFDGKRIDGASADKIVRMGIAHVPEGRRLFPQMPVVENLRMGAVTRKDRKEIERDLEEIYQYFPILKERARNCAHDLSGGEQQMLAIARALMAKPRLLLLDEPLQGLAPILVMVIQNIILRLNKQQKITVLLVEQNIHVALGIAHEVHIIEGGRIIHSGQPKELSESEYVQKVYLAG